MSGRILPFYLALIFLPFVLVGRLAFLQLIEGTRNRQLAEGNRILEKRIAAPRGIIYDRKGQPLVRNVPGYKIKVQSEFEYRRVSREEALAIETQGGSETASLEMEILREYLYPEELAHVLGYLGKITPEELESLKFKNYQMDNWVGKTGVEVQFESILRGKEGKELIEVDARGRQIRTLAKIEPRPGESLNLALDLDLQKMAFEALGEAKGAVIAQNPQTGEVLVLVSRPSFDPNLFTVRPDEEKVVEILADQKEMYLFNRAISGTYPPGSTFKIVTAAAGLETGKINEKTQIEDVGEIIIGPYRFPNWYLTQYGKTEGLLDLVGAIRRSNDIFFYKVAEWVGEKTLGEWSKKFGLGQKLGIDLDGEATGLIPTPQWKEKNVGDKWYLGDTYHWGIGQGYILTTPLQVNAWTAVVANGGTLYKPHLLKTSASAKASADKQNFLKKETVELIKEGMKEACSEGGTGWPLFNFRVTKEINGTKEIKEIETACKTGTAEYGDPQGKTHAWFTVFAPVDPSADGPEIVVTVLVEGGGEGSSVAAPVAKKVLEAWFSE